jgi:CRISPR-associated endonuclease/helicase Cas3
MTNVDGMDRYVAAAGGRPEWMLWGKARPESHFVVPAHPLLCHMVDVAAVAEAFLCGILAAPARARLLEPFEAHYGDAVHWLPWLVALHDMGKASPPFQVKWEPAVARLVAAGFDMRPPRQGRDHGTLGVAMVREALVGYGVDPLFAHRLGRAVAAHHGAFPTDYRSVPPCVGGEGGRSPLWIAARQAIVIELARVFEVDPSRLPRPARPRDWAGFSALAGFTSIADWVGSMADVFTYEPPPESLADYVPRARERAARALAHCGFRRSSPIAARSFGALFGFPPRPLQGAVADLIEEVVTPMCLVIEAPMGEGKTEAALYVSHTLDAQQAHEGTYIGLPTQATANQMFNRLSEHLERTRPDQRINLQLLHGEAVFDARVHRLLSAVYTKDDAADVGGLVCEPWFLGKKRALLAPFGAGTIDQALLAVLRTKHAFVRQFGLAGKTVILDEVHAYDTYTSTLLERLVAWLGALGATVILLSATLPSARRRALLEAYAGRSLAPTQVVPYPRLSWVDAQDSGVRGLATGRAPMRTSVEWMPDDDDAVTEVALRLAAGGANVGLLRNTVSRAQHTLRRLRERGAAAHSVGTPFLLLHARFPVEDRRRLEDRLIAMLGKGDSRPQGSIIVGTQVLEQSLDIDFDALVTDLAPIDLLLQRAGRLHRHARAERPPCAARPTLRIIGPNADPATANVHAVAPVYEPYVVGRTLIALRLRTEILLPDDIEPLVEAVYTDPEPLEWREALRRERDEMCEERTREEQMAKQRAWPLPTSPDDPFRDLDMPYEEDNPDIAQMLRAETRLGTDSAEIVCLFGSATRAFLDRAHKRQVDLDALPSREMVRALAQRTVKVATRGLVHRIAQLPLPSPWREVSLLERRRPVFFADVPVVIEDFGLQLDDELGLVIEHERKQHRVISADD